MSQIHIQREHRSTPDQVKQQIEGLAETLKERLAAEYHWQDDTLSFERKGASGHILVDDRQVEVRIKLGLLLRPFKSSVEEAVERYLDEYLT